LNELRDARTHGARAFVERPNDPDQIRVFGVDRHFKSRTPRQRDHRAIVPQHVADRAPEAAYFRGIEQPRHHARTQTLALCVVGEHERDFAVLLRISRRILRQRDHAWLSVVPRDGDEDLLSRRIRTRYRIEHGRGQLADRQEVAAATRFRFEAADESLDVVAIRRGDRPDRDPAAVGQLQRFVDRAKGGPHG